MAQKAKQAEEARLKSLPPKEREEAKRWAAKPTGKPPPPLTVADARLPEFPYRRGCGWRERPTATLPTEADLSCATVGR